MPESEELSDKQIQAEAILNALKKSRKNKSKAEIDKI